MKLSRTQQKIIVAMRGSYNDDYCYPYSFFEDETGLDRDVLRPEMKKLGELEIMQFARGLMNDDGEVCGSGWGTGNYTKFKEAYESVDEDLKNADTFKKDLLELTSMIGIDWSRRKTAVREIQNFINQHRNYIATLPEPPISADTKDNN